MKKIFITGISGFAGSHLAEVLNDDSVEIYGTYLSDSSISLVSHLNNIHLVKLDITKPEDVEKTLGEINPDEVYHLAALASPGQSLKEPGRVMTNNIEAQLNVLEALRKINSKARTLVVSSSEVYGRLDPKYIPTDENAPFMPVNPYAVSKLTQDFLGLQYYLAYNLNILRIRPFNHIGARQSDLFVTSAFAKKIAQIEKGIIPPVLMVGNLNAKRDFTHVKDMMRAYKLLMEKGEVGDVYNVGSGKSYKVSEILDILLSFAKIKPEVKQDPALLRPNDCPEQLCNNTKFTTLTGWKPELSVEQALEEVLNYWRENI